MWIRRLTIDEKKHIILHMRRRNRVQLLHTLTHYLERIDLIRWQWLILLFNLGKHYCLENIRRVLQHSRGRRIRTTRRPINKRWFLTNGVHRGVMIYSVRTPPTPPMSPARYRWIVPNRVCVGAFAVHLILESWGGFWTSRCQGHGRIQPVPLL